MPRREARSRSLIASELLLAEQDQRRSQPGPRRKSRRPVSVREGVAIQGFQLREDGPAPSHELAGLCLAFGDMFSSDTITAVLDSTAGNPDRAAEVLLSMAGVEDDSSDQPSCSSRATSPSLWDSLPEEIKKMVLRHLNVRDLSRAARVSREFALISRGLSGKAARLDLPPSLSMGAVTSAVAAFQRAQCISLRGWHSRLVHPEDWDNLMWAIAAGEAARSTAVPITTLIAPDLNTMEGHAVVAILGHLQCLEELHLRNSGPIGAGALRMMARHRPLDLSTSAGHSTGSHLWDDEQPGPGRLAALAASAVEMRREERLTSSRRGLRCLTLSSVPQDDPALSTLWDLHAATRHSLERLVIYSARVIVGQLVAKTIGSALKVLHVNGCHGPGTKVGPFLPAQLEELMITGSREVQHVQVQSAPRLQKLVVSACPSLSRVDLECPALQRLSIGPGCRALQTLQSNLPAARELSLIGCQFLPASDILSTVQQTRKLEMLILIGNNEIVQLQIPTMPGRTLRTVNVSGCRMLRGLTWFETTSAHGWSLEQLLATGCRNLEMLVVPGQRLRHVDLQNCAVLSNVQLLRGMPGANGLTPNDDRKQKRMASSLNLAGCAALNSTSKKTLREAMRCDQ